MVSPPSNVTVTSPTCTTRVVSWTPPANEVGNVIPDDTYPAESIEPYLVKVFQGHAYTYTGGANEVDVEFNGATQDGGGTYTFISDGQPFKIFYEPLQPVTATLRDAVEIVAYRLYRDEVLLQEVGPNITSFNDTVSAAPHVYSVSCVDANGGESALATWRSPAWQQAFGGTGPDQCRSVAVDADDNIIAAGYFQGTADFGAGPLSATTASGLAFWLAKYNSAGTCLWAKRFTLSAGGNGNVTGIAVDTSGNIFIGGDFTGTLNLGGNDLPSRYLVDIFLAKFNSSGVHQWSQSFGLAGYDKGSDAINVVKVDSVGDVIIAGQYLGQISFDGGQTFLGQSFTGGHSFVAKFDSSGIFQWARDDGNPSSGNNKVAGLAISSDNSIVLTGPFQGTINWGGADLVWDSTFGDKEDIFLVKLNANGGHAFSRKFGGMFSEMPDALTLDGDGDILITGRISNLGGTVGGSTFPNSPTGNIFIAKYSGVNGDHIWSRDVRAASFSQAWTIACDSEDNVYIGGDFLGPTDFGGGETGTDGTVDAFLAKYDGDDGAYIWSERINGVGGIRPGSERILSLAVDSEDFVIGVGSFGSALLPLGWQTFTNHSGTTDAFLYKRPPC